MGVESKQVRTDVSTHGRQYLQTHFFLFVCEYLLF